MTLPQPIKGYSNNGYRIRISEVGAEKARCSDDFYLMATADVPAVGEAGGPTMAVISPDEGSLAEAGGTYTVEVSSFLMNSFMDTVEHMVQGYCRTGR